MSRFEATASPTEHGRPNSYGRTTYIILGHRDGVNTYVLPTPFLCLYDSISSYGSSARLRAGHPAHPVRRERRGGDREPTGSDGGRTSAGDRRRRRAGLRRAFEEAPQEEAVIVQGQENL